MDKKIEKKLSALDPRFRKKISDLFASIHESVSMLYEAATHDEKTGLYNNKFFETVLEMEMEKAKRYQQKLSLLIIDIDFFKRINDTGFKVINVCIIDPIYKLCTKDIRDGEAALAIIRFSDTLYNKYNCTNVLIHHNTKTSYSSQGEKIDKEDSYYGHSFIKNHVRTSYAFKITGFNTRDLILKKGRGSDTRRKIHLEFNPETWTLNEASNLPAHKRGSHVERFFSFLESSLKAKRQLDASTILEECDITYNQLRTLKLKPETTALFSIQKTHDKNKEIWIPKII